MGLDRSTNGARPTQQERQKMENLLEEALDAGFVGPGTVQVRVVTERLGQAFRHIFGGYLDPSFDHRHVRGRNVDQVGQPVAGAPVTSSNASQRGPGYHWTTNPDGVAAFEITRQNETVALPSNPTVQSQIGETRSRGAEASAQIDLARGLKAIASYTYNEVEVVEAGGSQTTNGNRVPDRPDHLAKLWVDYSFQQPALDGLGLGAGLRYTSSSFADAANEARYPSATLVDAAIRYRFDDVTLQLSGRNVFDEVKLYCNGSQATSFCNYGVPRSVVGSLSYRWD